MSPRNIFGKFLGFMVILNSSTCLLTHTVRLSNSLFSETHSGKHCDAGYTDFSVIVNTNRGLCYLLYHSPSAASAAIAHMHESQLDGSKIEVSIVIPRRIPGSAGIPNPIGATPSGPGGRYRGAGGGRYRSPPRRPGQGVGGGRSGIGGGFGGRGGDSYRPKSRSRSVSRSRSSYSRSRSPSRSRSRSPYRSRRGGGRRRRSVSYSSYSSRSDSRSRSRSKGRKYSRSRSRSRDRRGGGGRDGRRR